ncbi:MAG TPA: tetratricopeptide repeat protein [Steroidobacteraceae bacterium]|nr:tetratricopeptide repeat protein [Steroidobacteraceae bacterium]
MNTRLRASVAVFILSLMTIPAFCAAYKPASQDEVLLHVDTAQRQARMNLHRTVDRNDPQSVIEAAGNFVALGRAQHDERFFGYASAILQPWHNDAHAPTGIVLLHADIAQYQHRFGDALNTLDQLVAREPNYADALLMRAAIRMSQGKPREARQDCQRLFSLREIFAATVCNAQAASLNGKLSPSYRLLALQIERGAIDRQNTKVVQQLAWAHGVLAEMAERLGDFAAAERELHTALDLSPVDFASRLQLCDLLLQSQRPREALQLIDALSPSDPILLRRALAAKQIADPVKAKETLITWQSAVERSTQLGVTLHVRELARGQLELLNSPSLALQSALVNWQVQREAIDARLLADAARAAHDSAALKQVRDWQTDLHFEDARLAL